MNNYVIHDYERLVRDKAVKSSNDAATLVLAERVEQLATYIDAKLTDLCDLLFRVTRVIDER